MSPLVTAPPVDRNTAILFGDGAGAVLVAPDSEAAGGNPWRIAGSSLHSDGTFASELQLTAEGRFAMNGLSVILQASRKLPRTIEEVLASAGIAAAGVDAFVLHQANQNLLNKVAAALGVPRERFFSQIARLGNTSSASLLIALAAWARSPEAQSARTAVLAAFGAGFHWGAMLLLRGAG
jgi:3-oxoacyl-[acyl-carrier-protein] synthase-3